MCDRVFRPGESRLLSVDHCRRSQEPLDWVLRLDTHEVAREIAAAI